AIFIPEGPSVTPASKKVFYLSSDPDKESGCFGTDRDLSPMLKIVEKSLLPNKLRVVEKLSRTHWRYPLNF
ncbi:MAG: hypothetical protein QMD66_07865, partial [Actinomycetota bacterium]|nr:hypothetical protein [Actinomycetota bacterium]